MYTKLKHMSELICLCVALGDEKELSGSNMLWVSARANADACLSDA